MLLEGLIAVLIFSMGILAIVGMQAAAVKASSDAKYRSEAGLLANQLLGAMWVSDRTPAILQAAFASPSGTAYVPWAWAGTDSANPGTQTVPAAGTVLATLPGAQANPPTVTVTDISSATSRVSQVTITIQWLAPNETASATPHRYSVIAEIGCMVQSSGLCT